MFERYTESARRILFFARYEASLLGSVSMGPEHFLLGISREGKGATRVLFDESQISLDEIRADIEGRIGHGEKIPTSQEIPFTAEAKRVLNFAASEADGLGHGYIGSEHLLLGILREETSLAASVLRGRGIQLNAGRETIVRLLSQLKENPQPVPTDSLGEQLDSVKRLANQLAHAERNSDEARELLTRIHLALDALKSSLH